MYKFYNGPNAVAWLSEAALNETMRIWAKGQRRLATAAGTASPTSETAQQGDLLTSQCRVDDVSDVDCGVRGRSLS